MVTRRPGLALGILSADCAPLLFADPEARVIGAAHAGWRGALAGVAEATVAAMVEAGARRAAIHAAIGPCIGRLSYEVGPEFPAPFLAAEPADRTFFRPGPRVGRFLFDLPGYIEKRLKALGLAAVGRLERDTCAEADDFFSYRRATHEGRRDYGRGLSTIALG
jgi:polyphenol oxidase